MHFHRSPYVKVLTFLILTIFHWFYFCVLNSWAFYVAGQFRNIVQQKSGKTRFWITSEDEFYFRELYPCLLFHAYFKAMIWHLLHTLTTKQQTNSSILVDVRLIVCLYMRRHDQCIRCNPENEESQRSIIYIGYHLILLGNISTHFINSLRTTLSSFWSEIRYIVFVINQNSVVDLHIQSIL